MGENFLKEFSPFYSKLIFWSLNSLFAVQWVFLAFDVNNRGAWVLENILVITALAPILWLYTKRYISTSSYIFLFIFLSAHNLGAHYTYSKVPYDEWLNGTFGYSLREVFDWERNHYDRLLHFLWGFLLYLPFKEISTAFTGQRGYAGSITSLLWIVATSACFEMVEWGVAVGMGESANQNYVGIQGDVWDAQKDQALALAGGVLAISVSWVISICPGREILSGNDSDSRCVYDV